jgi:hypothetical protein
MRIGTSTQNLKAVDTRLQELKSLLARYESTAKDDPAEWRFLGKIYELMTYSARELGRTDVPMEFARRSLELRRKAAERDPSFVVRGALANALAAYASILRITGDLSGAADRLSNQAKWKASPRRIPALFASEPRHPGAVYARSGRS